MQIIEGKLTKYTTDKLDEVIKQILKDEIKLFGKEVNCAEGRECAVSTLWNEAIIYLEDYSIEQIKKKIDREKLLQGKLNVLEHN